MSTAAADRAPIRATRTGPGGSPRSPVSGFFRDPEAFHALAGLVPALFRGKGADDSVRVWVAGCGTGEEAFSIAILLAEHAATLDSPPAVEMFATDADARGCARGRNALYPASAVACLPAARLKRWFAWEGGGYRVARPLREAVLFAGHDVLRDPAFERLNLVSCRNLPTGVSDEARTGAMATFHDSLLPGGVLFLGAGEIAGDGFSPAAEGHPLYRREDDGDDATRTGSGT
jgi:two-component system, chemotaxis family, CheB/CheR fusion protein